MRTRFTALQCIAAVALASPVVAADSVVIATEAGVLYTMDADNNQPRRLVNLEEKIYAPLATDQRDIYVHTERDVLYAVDVRSGAVREFNLKY